MILKREGPVIISKQFRDIKDPCPVFDGKMWHIYGSGGDTRNEKWKIFHAVVETITGPWKEEKPAYVTLNGPQVAAPGVIFDNDEGLFHMFVQTHCFAPNGTLEHLISSDGHRFNNLGPILASVPGTREGGIYDPHPAILTDNNGKKEYYVTYSGFPDSDTEGKRTDIYLAKSVGKTWYGPWERKGVILHQEDIAHHNQSHHEDYEWGMEGSQLVQLPNGKILLNAVCYLPHAKPGTKQRVFFAIADSIKGPFKTLGPILEPQENGWENGENGHAAAIVLEGKLQLFYQARPFNGQWKYGRAEIAIGQLLAHKG